VRVNFQKQNQSMESTITINQRLWSVQQRKAKEDSKAIYREMLNNQLTARESSHHFRFLSRLSVSSRSSSDPAQ
jgi:hypothetical protein